jgi:hydroxylamine reductase
MYCNQCEQAAVGGCSVKGVCGKKDEVAALQDLLTLVLRGLSMYANEGRKVGLVEQKVDRFTCEGLFATLTNVNFDPVSLQNLIHRAKDLQGEVRDKVKQAGGKTEYADSVVGFVPAQDLEALIKQGEQWGLGRLNPDPDIQSLQQLLIYGLRGLAAFAHHAQVLGQEDSKVYSFIQEGLAATANPDLTLDDFLALVLKCGEINLRAMELLDAGNTGTFGHPEPTKVPLGHKKGKCILISGHDLKDLQDLLEQTGGKGINIYTHGEMLPAHGYPELKKHPHLAGHYGTAWQNQKKDFANFPGPILMTTNCIQEPQESYKENIFTTGPVGWPGVTYLKNGQFDKLISKALEMPGFASDEDKGFVMTGFARNAVLGVADEIIAGVKSGKIKHFFLVAGCDGAKPGRNYYTEFVEKTPQDTVVLTLACGKFRFFDKQLGDIGGIPRLLDVGQCNDAYSAIQIALALAKAFNCSVNELPLSMVLSWYEQKAVVILLTLLYLGIKDIRLGPSLPAFITPNILKVLSEKFGLKPITTAEQDLEAILGAKSN